MRILVVLRDPLDVEVTRERCAKIIAAEHEIGVCYVLRPGTTMHEALETQRKITSVLRRALNQSAEAIPVFVVSGAAGDDVAQCAEQWGASEVQT